MTTSACISESDFYLHFKYYEKYNEKKTAIRKDSVSYSSIRDNNSHGSVADFLKENIPMQSKLSIVSAYFTIYARKLKSPTKFS